MKTQIDLYCCEHELLVGAVRLLNRFGTVIEAAFNCVPFAEISPTRVGKRHPDPDKIVQAEAEQESMIFAHLQPSPLACYCQRLGESHILS